MLTAKKLEEGRLKAMTRSGSIILEYNEIHKTKLSDEKKRVLLQTGDIYKKILAFVF